MKRAKIASQRVVRPISAQWEVWDLPEGGEQPPTNGSTHPVPPVALDESDLLAIPARLVVSAALWVPTVEAAELDESVRLELELSGLPAPKAVSSSITLRTVVEENGRTLVACSLFPTDLSDALAGLRFRRFEASPHLLKLPENAATIWREGDDLVLCFTRGAAVVVWETIHADASDLEIALWLRLTTTQLQAEGVIPRWLEWHDPNEVLANREIPVPQGGKWVTTRGEIVNPKLPGQLATWQPPSTLQVIDQSRKKQKIRQFVYVSLGAYLALIVFAIGYIGFMKIQASIMESESDQLAATVETFAPVSEAWQLVSSTVETEQFPLEILLQLVTNMPESGIRLTALTMNDNEVLVEGEAASATLASNFFDSIERDDDFQYVAWEMPPPSLLPNSTARFQMRGTILSL